MLPKSALFGGGSASSDSCICDSSNTPVSTNESFAPCQAIPQLLYDFFKEISAFFLQVFFWFGVSLQLLQEAWLE